MYIKEEKIDKLYKRIMKQDITAIDEIESLEQAKEIIKMLAGPMPMILKTSVYDAELIHIHGETDTDWIGSYCEGFVLVNVKFAKEDCRDATDEEIKLCKLGLMKTIKF